MKQRRRSRKAQLEGLLSDFIHDFVRKVPYYGQRQPIGTELWWTCALHQIRVTLSTLQSLQSLSRQMSQRDYNCDKVNFLQGRGQRAARARKQSVGNANEQSECKWGEDGARRETETHFRCCWRSKLKLTSRDHFQLQRSFFSFSTRSTQTIRRRKLKDNQQETWWCRLISSSSNKNEWCDPPLGVRTLRPHQLS